MEDEFRRTPTWRAKCRILGSGRPLRFEHWGAHEDLSLPAHVSKSRKDLSKKDEHTTDTRFILVQATIVV